MVEVQRAISARQDVFVLPILDRFLLYAPLCHFAALVNGRAVDAVRRGLRGEGREVAPSLRLLVETLRSPPNPLPALDDGPLREPLFLGLVPTRDCNMSCRYCDFPVGAPTSPAMSLELARAAIDGYLQLLGRAGAGRGEIHFFGGEPFKAKNVVHFAVGYARAEAYARRVDLRFEVTTNGLYDAHLCRWIAEHFDTVVLSLDGPADVQDAHRPTRGGGESFDVVTRNARILSEGAVRLVVRACVTRATVRRLPLQSRPGTLCSPLASSPPLSWGTQVAEDRTTKCSFTYLSSPHVRWVVDGGRTLIVDVRTGEVRISTWALAARAPRSSGLRPSRGCWTS